jgi:predicted RNase H-like HicB family nuclease
MDFSKRNGGFQLSGLILIDSIEREEGQLCQVIHSIFKGICMNLETMIGFIPALLCRQFWNKIPSLQSKGKKIMETYRFQVIIEQDEDGFYVADVPALKGCHSQGETFEEALENIREVIEMCIQEIREDGESIETRYPEVIGIKTLEIAV